MLIWLPPLGVKVNVEAGTLVLQLKVSDPDCPTFSTYKVQSQEDPESGWMSWLRPCRLTGLLGFPLSYR